MIRAETLAGLQLNPYYEIASRLGAGSAFSRPDFPSCFRDRLRWIGGAWTELAPFVALVLAKAEALPVLGEYALTDALRHLFGFAIPTPAAVKRVAALGSIVEIGAGSGYWAALIAGAGARVTAYDNFSWGLDPLWYKVRRGGATRAAEPGADTLLLCWPPYKTSAALRALRAFRGDHVVYVGEGAGGCTASDAFHAALDDAFELAETAPSVTWPGLHDTVQVWRRM